MPTVIDSFVLELGLDPSKFTRGQREAMDSMRRFQEAALRGGNEIESQNKRVFDLLSSFRREALTTLGLFFGGREAGEFVSFITSLDAATGRFATTIGQTARETSDWQGAFEQIGGTAETATAALGGLSAEMSRFQLTGQSAILPVLSRLGVSLYDQNRNLKTAGQLWLDLADAVHGMDPRQAVAFLRMIPGANQDMINFALMGRQAMERYLADADKARRLTDQNVHASKAWQKEMGLLERAALAVGEKFAMWLLPIAALKSLRELLSSWTLSPESKEGKAVVSGERAAAEAKFGSPRGFMEWMRDHFSMGDADRAKWDAIISNWYGAAGGAGTVAEHEAYIRSAATARGIDPDVAVAVARSEGLFNPVGDRGSSFGDYQLHYGGIASGGMAASGLGDVFTKTTGLNARDPSMWRAQIDFALDQAARGGWGPWHGWKGAPYAGLSGAHPAGGGGAHVTIGAVHVHTRATDADGIAKDIAPALKRSITAGAANQGPT